MAERSDYVKTGSSAFTRWGNKISLVPVIGAAIAAPLFTIGLLIDSGKWLLRGKIGSAATEFATGSLSAGLNAISGATGGGALVWWLGKVGIAGATGHTIGTHGRAVAESLIGSVSGALGLKPQVLRSYPAGIGAVPGAGAYYPQQQAPGYWATRASQEQGKDPEQHRQQYLNGGGREHVAALQDAAQRPQMRGI